METAHSENIGRFVSGSVKTLQLGKPGSKVLVKVHSGSQNVVIYRRSRGRTQQTVGPNSRNTRRKAVDVAKLVVAHLENASIPRNAPARAGAQGAARPRLTVADVWQEYLRSTLPGIPTHALTTWSRKEVAPFIAARVRNGGSPMSVDSLVTLLQCARRLDESQTFPFERDIGEIEFNDVQAASLERVGRHARSTILTDLRRMRTAIRRVALGNRKMWGGRQDPLALMPKIGKRSEGSGPKQIGDEMAHLIVRELKDRGAWRAWATCEILFRSGRRIGAVGGARKGLHIWGPPLTADDLLRDENGRVAHIVWRPEPAKGGDDMGKSEKPLESQILPVGQEFAKILEETVSTHPNPLGPSHPIIWAPGDPRQAVSYAALNKAFRKAWAGVVEQIRKERGSDEAAHYVRPKGLAFHGFCRNVITMLVREQGLAEAARFTGRTKDTVVKYLRPADDSVNESAEILDRR